MSSETEATGNDLAFVKLFEIMAPIRDYSMFGVASLSESDWNSITSVMTDCDIKTSSYIGATPSETYYGSEDLYALMTNPENTLDIHNEVLKYLEESQLELICIMADTGSWDAMGHCDGFRDSRGLAEGESSTCWESYYSTIQDTYDVVLPEGIESCYNPDAVTETETTTTTTTTPPPPPPQGTPPPPPPPQTNAQMKKSGV